MIGSFAALVLAVLAYRYLPSSSEPQAPQVQPFQAFAAHSPSRQFDHGNIITARPSSAPAARPPRRLENGTIITQLSSSGNGTLTIDNGTERDAVVKVRDERTETAVVAFYVCSGQTATIEHMPDGYFRLIFGSGSDWDSTAGKFKRDRLFTKFDKELNFVTTRRALGDEIYYEYSIFTLTLHPVVYGNAKTTSIGEKEFLKY
jgi:hypothetical protein